MQIELVNAAAHDRGRHMIASVERGYYRPRHGQCDCTVWAKSDIYDCPAKIVLITAILKIERD